MAAWIAKGGDAALASYGGDPADVPQTHVDWLDGLRLTYSMRIASTFTPASTPNSAGSARRSHSVVEALSEGISGSASASFMSFMAMIIVPEGPLLYEGRTNLDTLAWRTGRLTVGVFDDDRPGGPVDFIVIRGASRPGVSRRHAPMPDDLLCGLRSWASPPGGVRPPAKAQRQKQVGYEEKVTLQRVLCS